LHIRRHDPALAQMNYIVRHEFLRSDAPPFAIPSHARLDTQLLPQQGQRFLRPPFLKKSEYRV